MYVCSWQAFLLINVVSMFVVDNVLIQLIQFVDGVY